MIGFAVLVVALSELAAVGLREPRGVATLRLRRPAALMVRVTAPGFATRTVRMPFARLRGS